MTDTPAWDPAVEQMHAIADDVVRLGEHPDAVKLENLRARYRALTVILTESALERFDALTDAGFIEMCRGVQNAEDADVVRWEAAQWRAVVEHVKRTEGMPASSADVIRLLRMVDVTRNTPGADGWLHSHTLEGHATRKPSA